jgi:hypothetical protein
MINITLLMDILNSIGNIDKLWILTMSNTIKILKRVERRKQIMQTSNYLSFDNVINTCLTKPAWKVAHLVEIIRQIKIIGLLNLNISPSLFVSLKHGSFFSMMTIFANLSACGLGLSIVYAVHLNSVWAV